MRFHYIIAFGCHFVNRGRRQASRSLKGAHHSHRPHLVYSVLTMSSMPYYTQTSQPPATPGTYPYGAYHPGTPGLYTQTPGTYSYSAAGAYPATAITGYGATAWPYSYSYYQQHVPVPPRPSVATPSAAAQTQTTVPAATHRTTFSVYQPAYPRESFSSASLGSSTSRGYRKQSNVKGLFTKECTPLS